MSNEWVYPIIFFALVSGFLAGCVFKGRSKTPDQDFKLGNMLYLAHSNAGSIRAIYLEGSKQCFSATFHEAPIFVKGDAVRIAIYEVKE